MSFAIPAHHHMAGVPPSFLTVKSNGHTQHRNGSALPSPTTPTASSHGHAGPSSSALAAVPMSVGLSAATLPNAAGPSTSNLVAEFLKSPDDLTKISALRKKLLKEQSSLSAKLKLGAKEQLEATRDGLLKLQATRKDVAAIREAFAQVEALYTSTEGEEGSRSNHPDANRSFRIISQVSQIHRNFVQTTSTLEKLDALPGQIEQLAEMLQRSQDDIMGPATDLLPLHFHLSQLEAFRNETFQIARTCSADVRNTISEVFAPLDGLIRAFDDYIMVLAERTMDLVREGRPAVVVKLVKIIEKESREDERAAAIRLAKRANLEGAARFRSVVANARVIKLYRPKFVEAIDRSTAELFDECWSRFGADDTSLEFLGHLDWIYDDMRFVQSDLTPLFPPDYKILRTFVKSYHKHLGSILRERILAKDPEASALLELYQFTQEYTKTMTKEIGADKAWLEPTLLAGKEQGIIDDYLGLITKKIDEWTANLMSDEVREFVARQNPPDEDNEGQYGLQGAAILFQMVNQQVDVAADSGQASVLAKVVDHAAKAMHSTQATWLRVLEGEFKKQREAKTPDDVVGGLVEYVIALANDQLKSADYAEALIARLEPMVSQKYQAGIREAVDNALNGFLDVSKRCTQVLVDLVFADLQPAIKDLFAFPVWYSEGTMTTIVETMRDYTTDYSERLNPDLFDVLCDDMMDRLLVSYIGALRRVGNGKLRMPAAGEQMRKDAEDAKTLFLAFKKEQEVGDKFEVLEAIRGMLTSSATMVFLPYWSFAKAHGAHLGFLEAIMKARDDLKRDDVNALMESARRKVKSEGLNELVPETGGPTVMSRVAQAYGASFGGGLLANLGGERAAGMAASATQALKLTGWKNKD
ncbi:related to SEC6-protein transport protein [Sporisorium reilianum SRZ2]|uniref:Related to SEC6-protein transport protein n=1 Tax=Sporisorium reilianum (strain SRZ2) TaxID=999809 RepID=E7A340_SPORE|nr:related to SEC6-protein transport protein [Sporisorium reilianum SRZ2]